MSAAKRRAELEVSYGGLALRINPETHKPEVVVIRPRGKNVLALPKGGAEPGEEGATAAAREIREEAGVEVTVREYLLDVKYWYRRSGKLISKVVHFYLCDYVSGDPSQHDHEVDDAFWLPLEDACTELSFPGERKVAARALSKVVSGL